MILSMKELLFSRTKTTRFFIGFPVRPSQGVRGIFVFRTKNRSRKQEAERKTGTDRSKKPVLEEEKKPETETRSGAEKRHRQKHETGARSGKQPETETRSGAENRHRQKHKAGASALQNPKARNPKSDVQNWCTEL